MGVAFVLVAAAAAAPPCLPGSLAACRHRRRGALAGGPRPPFFSCPGCASFPALGRYGR